MIVGMSADAETAQIGLSLSQAFQPTTFLERGVAVPFTTPALAGARARPGVRGGTEILVRNPSGGRGLYILPWSGICQLCRPTVHDAVLHQRIEALQRVTPETIRRVARDLAAEGLAGREAAASAAAAADAERNERIVTNFHLLLALIEQAAPAERAAFTAEGADQEDLKHRARNVIVHISPKLGRTPESLADGLEGLSGIFVGIGMRGQQPLPRIPRLFSALRRLRDDMRDWQPGQDPDAAGAAGMIAAVAELTLFCAEKTIADARAVARNVPDLLQRWQASPAAVTDLAVRPAWLLDGWEPICLIWQQAKSEAARRAAVSRIAMLVPVLPREASDWVGKPIDTDFIWFFRRTVRLNEDWRTGVVFDLIVGNERLRAMAI